MLFDFMNKLLTKNNTKIPLFITYFDYIKYKKDGKKNSCVSKIHPLLANDEFVKHYLGIVIDYIRDTYDLEEL